MPKNNPRAHSTQQNKKAVLTTAAYFKIFTPVGSQRKSEKHHWILHIQITAGTKVQLKLTSLIFWTKFAQKGCFWSQTEKMNSAIEFCICKLVEVPNFSLNRQFWFLDQVWPKRVLPIKNGQSEHHHWILHIRISLGTKFQLKLTILIFFWPILLKKGISGRKRKNRTCAFVYGRYYIKLSARGPTDTTVF